MCINRTYDHNEMLKHHAVAAAAKAAAWAGL